jgi:hypothetical protein
LYESPGYPEQVDSIGSLEKQEAGAGRADSVEKAPDIAL